jgi:P27 family predicted phage terminase small subunit
VPPDGLDPGGRKAWDRVVPVLAEMGILCEVDAEALALYCHTTSVSERAWGAVAKEGLTITSITGVERPHPAATIAHRADQLRLQIMAEFGMTPSSRSRVRVESQPRDALADFLGKKESKHV